MSSWMQFSTTEDRNIFVRSDMITAVQDSTVTGTPSAIVLISGIPIEVRGESRDIFQRIVVAEGRTIASPPLQTPSLKSLALSGDGK